MAIVILKIVEFGRRIGELVVDRDAITGVAKVEGASDCPFMVHVGKQPVSYGIDEKTYEELKERLLCRP
ncbi:MAG TPA: hypothetical protein VFA99_14540 [Acidobacteriaceae bacterium]|nr:hypothetical protein [Acidobacteriaceae bacterium]